MAIISYRAPLVLCSTVLDRLIQAVGRVKADRQFTLENAPTDLKSRIEQAIITFASLFACADANVHENRRVSAGTPLKLGVTSDHPDRGAHRERREALLTPRAASTRRWTRVLLAGR